jgi:molybdate transport system substrate-binding protein
MFPPRIGHLFLTSALLPCAAFGCARHAADGPSLKAAGTVTVAAAADLKFALDEVLAEFRREHPDVRAEVTYGSSGNFFAQLLNRAPFDLFLSADLDYPRRLIAEELAPAGSEFVYAVGHLVVWAPRARGIDVERLGIQAMLDPGVRKVAIANPAYAPYGRAAEAALKAMGVYDQVRERLVLGENVSQTAQFLQTGAADIGLLPLSLARAPALRDEGVFWPVPEGAHPPLEQGGVILSWAQDRAAAEALRDFITGAEGKAVLRRFGFTVPGE